jgi:hypothetical protein
MSIRWSFQQGCDRNVANFSKMDHFVRISCAKSVERTVPVRISGKALDPLYRFRVAVCWNPHMATQLRKHQKGLCPICVAWLSSQSVIHHMDYAHECRWPVSEVVIVAGKKKTVPDCSGCQADDHRRFNACRRRLRLMHRRCHLAYHRGEKNLRELVGE